MPLCLHHAPHTAAAADRDAGDLMGQELRLTAEITVQQLENAARDDALPIDEYPQMEWLGEIDETSCELCADLDGQIISREDPEYDDAQPPAHMNCRCILVGVGADEVGPDGEPTKPDWDPDPELVEKHGHFLVDKERYAPLRVISQPEGRDFIATVVEDSQGRKRAKLTWRIPEYDLPGYEAPE